MNAADLAENAALEWHKSNPEQKAVILGLLFERAWADLAKHLKPQVVTYPIEPGVLPHGITVKLDVDSDDPTTAFDEEVRWVRQATFADLRAAVNIIYSDVLVQAEYLKALGLLLASKTLDGAKDDDLLFDPVPASAAEARS